MPIFLIIISILIVGKINEVYASQSFPGNGLAVISTLDSNHLKIEKRKKSLVIRYSLRNILKKPENRRTTIALPGEFTSSPFYDANELLIFDDAVPAVEVTGLCGNKACEKLIYRFSKPQMSYQLFFQGSYSGISIYDGHLVEAGASGCCGFEYHAYKLPVDNKRISDPPNVVIEVASNTGNSSNEAVECAFLDAKGFQIAPPSSGWLRFCEIYGTSFKLRK